MLGIYIRNQQVVSLYNHRRVDMASWHIDLDIYVCLIIYLNNLVTLALVQYSEAIKTDISIKGSVTVCYISVYDMSMSLFVKMY